MCHWRAGPAFEIAGGGRVDCKVFRCSGARDAASIVGFGVVVDLFERSGIVRGWGR